jgi:hypothetical protein
MADRQPLATDVPAAEDRRKANAGTCRREELE